ncbi:hypothetical protein [Nannocystis radixulma]|uniref:Lipoprotein n=1 Tax=Nannocystis radixulma TaxID=2995305 RepID=A0ABT5BIX6_9BACT|nr:hypothetical protein [Nannocystis radixulma]MDC0673469.1 hypothetical protein [Nannocystis radixulma]
MPGLARALLVLPLLVGCASPAAPAQEQAPPPAAEAVDDHTAAAPPPQPPEPEAPASPPAELAVESPGASPEIVQFTPRIALPVEFHLVATRADEIELHADGSSVALIATVPYPIGPDGSPQPLQGVTRGLLPVDSIYGLYPIAVAGSFSRPGDGWLVLLAEDLDAPRPRQGVSVAYQWAGDGWSVVRERSGAMFRTYDHFLVRGDAIFAYPRLDRLPDAEAAFVDPDREHTIMGDLLRLRGTQLPPRGPGPWCTASREATTSAGDLYQIARRCPDAGRLPCSGPCTLDLFHWPAGAVDPVVTPLPEVAADEHRISLDQLRIGVFADGIAVYGAAKVEGHPHDLAYLAAGPANALRRIAIEHDGRAIVEPIVAALPRPDGEFWLVMHGTLWQRDASGRLRPFRTPTVSFPELADWAWGGVGSGWRRTGTFARLELENQSPEIAGVAAAGDSLWLTLAVPTHGLGEAIQAIFKTGPHAAPVVLPDLKTLQGDVWRRDEAARVVQLLADLPDDRLPAFESAVLPELVRRAELRQIYRAREGTRRPVIAIIDVDAARAPLLRALAGVGGVEPKLVSPPPELERMLHNTLPR